MTRIDWMTPTEDEYEQTAAPQKVSLNVGRGTTAANENANTIVVEIVGRHVDLFCHEAIGVRVKNNGNGRFSDRPKIGRINGPSGPTDFHLARIPGIQFEPHHLFIMVGCREAADNCCRIPLHNHAMPTAASYDAGQWPTSLIPVIPLAHTEPGRSRSHARLLREGWLYIFLNGHLWRELAVCADGSFRDVNFELPHVPGEDRRKPSGHAVSEVLVPHRIDGRLQQVEMAFSEVQWSWDRICAMGGPAPDDPRFEKSILGRCGHVAANPQLRAERFTRLDMEAVGNRFREEADPLFPIDDAPVVNDGRGKDRLSRYRGTRIAVVILEDALGVARNLAADYQRSWHDMENCLRELATAPERDRESRTYAPQRWFDAAVVANHFFFSPFPDVDHWRTIHSRTSHKIWDSARSKRRSWKRQLDQEAIENALGSGRRGELRNRIAQSKHRLVSFLRSETQDPGSLLMLMMDDYFVHNRRMGTTDDEPHGFQGYLGAWQVMEQLTARLADHPFSLDAVLEAAPLDTCALLKEDPGVAFLSELADPDRNHPLHAKLFPKAAAENPFLPGEPEADDPPTHFRAVRLDARQCVCLSLFASHYARVVFAADNQRVRQTLLRFIKAVFDLDVQVDSKPFDRLLQNAVRCECPPELIDTLRSKACGRELRLDDLLPIMAGWHVFGAKSLSRPTEKESGDSRYSGSFDSLSSSPLGSKVYFNSDRCESLSVFGHNGLQIGHTSIDAFIRGDLGRWNGTDQPVSGDCRPIPVELASLSDGPNAAIPTAKGQPPWMNMLCIARIALLLESLNLSALLKALRSLLADGNPPAPGPGTEAILARSDEQAAVLDLIALSTSACILHRRAESASRENGADPVLGIKGESESIGCSAYDAASALCPESDGSPGLQRDLFCSAVFASPLCTGHLSPVIKNHGIRSIVRNLSVLSAAAVSALLVNLFKNDRQIEQWLDHGPFSYEPYPLAIVTENDSPSADGNGALKVDSQGCLVTVLSDNTCRLLQTGNTIHLTCREGKPIREIAAIGEKVHPDGIFKDPVCRFGGHRPGDTDYGVPEGGCHTRRRYPGTTRAMEFWREPDGSFLWIDEKGRLFDYKLVKGGRLFEKSHTLFARNNGRSIAIGKLGEPLRNRSCLQVDRKFRDDLLRRWCEEPGMAADALLSGLFIPQIQLGFSCKRRKNSRLPDADPYKGYDYVTIMLITLPCFMENRSRLWVQLWEQYDAKPILVFDKRIFIVSQRNIGARQFAVTWPLSSVYARHTKVTARVRLDLYGDGSLCLPLDEKAANGGFPAQWSTVSKAIDKFSLRACGS